MVLIVLYVDDILIARSTMDVKVSVKEELSGRFDMKDSGEAKICRCLEVDRKREEEYLSLNQKTFMEKIHSRFNMIESKPVLTTIKRLPSKKDITGKPFSCTIYRQAIGRLMNLMTGTTPDLAFALGCHFQYMESPTEP